MEWDVRFRYPSAVRQFTLLTHQAHVLLCVARDPDVRLRTVADCAGITERAAHRIVCELEEAGYLTRHRLGRRNFYEVHLEAALSHPLERGVHLGDVLKPLLAAGRLAEPEGDQAGGKALR
jgi:DNA-binding IclR family transcriptional regulator